MIKRTFTTHLKHFLFHVESHRLDDGSEVHRVTVRFPLDRAPNDCKSMQFEFKAAWEVLDLLEVVRLSNELVESLGTKCEGPAASATSGKPAGGAA
jgi:hypothetical protein